jgi:tRNA(Ile2) C34 agmatinyltransferase TiaS
VLHHMDHPEDGVAEALRVAHKIIIVEPNGWNPVLKVIEKTSKYHIEHGERSFTSRLIESWCTSQGARVTHRTWAGLVPFFCPEPFARFLKTIEPVVEKIPVARQLSCAVFAVTAERPA